MMMLIISAVVGHHLLRIVVVSKCTTEDDLYLHRLFHRLLLELMQAKGETCFDPQYADPARFGL